MKLKHLLLTALCAVMSVGAWAQSWTEGAEAATGKDFYLYNIKSGMYVNHGSSWTTHVTVDGDGDVVTLWASGSNFKIHLGGNAGGKDFSADGWSDANPGTALIFEKVVLAGYTNAYYIKTDDSNGYYWNGGIGDYGDECLVGSIAEHTSAATWLLIPKENRTADRTDLIINPDFTADAGNWVTGWTTGFDTHATEAGHQPWYSGKFAEKWTAAPGTLADLSHKQSITVPAGKYTLSVNAQAIQQDGDVATTGTFVYAGGNQTEIIGNTIATHSVDFVSTGAAVEIGVKTVSTTANWVSFDKFRLTFLGSALINDAVELPNNGDMEADQWYYIDILATSAHTITATTLGDIIYTFDGEQLTTSATGSAVEQHMNLEKGRYYVKSTSANNLSVAAGTLVYKVGAPSFSIADGKYIQGTTTVNVTFPEAESNDPAATLVRDNAKQVTVNGEAVVLSDIANGFSFTISDPALSQSYEIVVPAELFAYVGNATSEAATITIHTPAVLNGTYFMWNTYTQSYLSRGAGYGTQAHLDQYGLPVVVATDADGLTTIKYYDSNLNLGDDGFCYTDCSGARIRNYTVAAVAEGLKFLNTSNDKYLAVFQGNAVGDAVEGGNLDGTSNVWALESASQHATKMDALKSALVSYDDSNYNLSDVALTTLADKKDELFETNGTLEETLEVENGLYKVSVQAYNRFTGHANAWALNGAKAGNAYLFANDSQVQLCGLFDQTNPSTTSRHGNDVKYGEYYYPDRTAGGDAAFEAGNYWNVLYVEVTDGQLHFGISDPSKAGGDWVYYSNFKVEKMAQASAAMSITSVGIGTFVAPFDVTLPAGVTAYTATVNGEYATMNEVAGENETLAAGTPVIVKSASEVNETFYGKSTIAETICTSNDNDLVGSLAAQTVPSDGTYYALQNGAEGLGFYKIDNAGYQIKANRAYLKTRTPAANIRMVFGDETGIKAVESTESGVMYNISGLRVNDSYKGIVIKNGKKYLNK